MKICILTTSEPNRLQDYLILGLRRHYGVNLIDYPQKELLYRADYGLENIQISRENVETELLDGDFDLLIFGALTEQSGLVNHMASEMFFSSISAQPIFLHEDPTDLPLEVATRYGPIFSFSSKIPGYIPLEPPISGYPKSKEEWAKIDWFALNFLEEVVNITDPEESYDPFFALRSPEKYLDLFVD